MKVAELRSNLAKRGLDTKGTKPVLVARLINALNSEQSPEEKAVESGVSFASDEEPSLAVREGQKGCHMCGGLVLKKKHKKTLCKCRKKNAS